MRYRDKLTGHFVSKSTWLRSKAQGGTRYVRQSSKGGGRNAPGVEGKGREQKQNKAAAMGSGAGGSSSPPAPDKIKTIKDYYDYYDDYGQYDDYGEVETGIDY